MKRIAILSVVALALLLSVSAFALDFGARQVDFCTEYVTLREEPSTSANEICTVDIGEVVMAADYDSRFAYCCYNGRFGYILRDYLNPEIAPWSEGTFRIANCDASAPMRPIPDSRFEAFKRIPRGTTLDKIIYHDGTYVPDHFAYVCCDGLWGFVEWRYLEVVGGQ